MLRVHFFVLCQLLFIPCFIAQTEQISLKSAVEMAVSNSPDLKKARLDAEKIKKHFKEMRSAGLPQINGRADLAFFPELPTQFFPGEFLNRTDQYLAVQVGRPWSFSAGFTMEQMLYSAALRPAIAAKKATENLQEQVYQKTEQDVVWQTAQLFYQNLQLRQLVSALDGNLKRLDVLEKSTTLLAKTGYTTSIDAKRVKVAKRNLETQKQNLLTGIENMDKTLGFLCSGSEKTAFSPELSPENAADSLKWLNLDANADHATEYKMLMGAIEMNRVQQRMVLSTNYPTLKALAAVQYQQQRNDGNFFDVGSRWYGMTMLGVNMTVPIFDGWKNHNKNEQLKLEWQKLETDRTRLLEYKNLEFKIAKSELRTTLNNLKIQEENTGLAKEIFEKMSLQYQEGTITLGDLLGAQSALSEAESNYWQMFYAYKLATVKVAKSLGLPSLLF